MRNRGVLAIAVAALIGLALLAFGAGVVPDSSPVKGPARTLGGARMFMLQPDGKVEISDSWARRVYKWDGRRWVELEVTRLAPPPAEMR